MCISYEVLRTVFGPEKKKQQNEGNSERCVPYFKMYTKFYKTVKGRVHEINSKVHMILFEELYGKRLLINFILGVKKVQLTFTKLKFC
jgi:hypothetical protein